MARIENVCACVLLLGANVAFGAHAQYDEQDGPPPVDSTQSVSAGADQDIHDKVGVALRPPSGAPAMGHSSGTYTGVVPGAAQAAKPPKAPSPQAPLTITWPGFQMRPDGSSRVFIQSNKPLETKVLKSADGMFELEFPGARVAAKTNQLPLDTRYFNTPVTKVSVHAARSGAIVDLNLRASVTPQITGEQGPAGYYFTYIELPKGEYVATVGGPTANAPTLQMAQPVSPLATGSSSAMSGSASTGANVPTLQSSRRSSKVIGKTTAAWMSGSGRVSGGSSSSVSVGGSSSGGDSGEGSASSSGTTGE